MRIRTSNILERAFREIRRRTDVVGRFQNEMSALSMIFCVLEEDRLNWRGPRTGDEERREVGASVVHLCTEPIEIRVGRTLKGGMKIVYK